MIDASPFFPLFVPADRPERYAKAAGAGADAIIVDLEDAVAAGAKDAARAALVGRLREGGLGAPVLVRVNAPDTPFFEADVAALRGLEIAGIVLPKAESAQAVRSLRAGTGWPVVALVESARGLARARELAAAADRLAFGSIDFALSIGAAHRREALLLARSELVLAAALAGRPAPLDGVTTSVSDPGAVEDDAAYAAALGLGGKLLIHPRQLAPAIRGFAPAPAQAQEAGRIVEASGGEAVKLDGRMVDLPVVEAARTVLARHERAASRLAALGAGGER
ncbi:HpcH/HpaI aldolase/citrate lyase family protein [Aureimonas populi]|uniref:HpcH/HpaI aldolase/citrate lyase family protein n=1 Tax=Aureimonas populi TaxID=1701758 RepID=A0ABW5CQD9_9HYPH|nr:aldolase/citrate lyase family protein [Aureimonas populi]